MALTLHGGFTVSRLLKEILAVIQGTDVSEVDSSVQLFCENSKDVPSSCPVFNFRRHDRR
jgi:hypothetical protein